MLANVEGAIAFSKSSFTYLVGVMYRRRAPQKVRPKPMKARMDEA